jgi:hypothetical protein
MTGYAKLHVIDNGGRGGWESEEWKEKTCPLKEATEHAIGCEGCTYYTEHKGWKYGDCKNCKESLTGHALRDPNWFCADYLPRAKG